MAGVRGGIDRGGVGGLERMAGDMSPKRLKRSFDHHCHDVCLSEVLRSLLPITRVLVSILPLAIIPHRYEKHFIYLYNI